MSKQMTGLKLLLVDDEDDFRRATSPALRRRGFIVTEAASGEEALLLLDADLPDIVILDLKMPGLSGIETLEKIREKDQTLPVIILTGHGDLQDALAGIRLKIVDFLQKPVDVEQLSIQIHSILKRSVKQPLRERTIAELIKSPSLYPRLYIDEPVTKVLETFQDVYSQTTEEGKESEKVRSVLIYNRSDTFLGVIRFPDLLKLVMPPFLDAPHTTFFTGMFLAQCKLIGKRNIMDLMAKQVFISVQAPIMEAVHLMIKGNLINLPVMIGAEIVGILRNRDVILEIANSIRTPELANS